MKTWFYALRGLNAFMHAFPDWECKTIGYMDPGWSKWHCGACTFNAIRKTIWEAYDFWNTEDRHKRAIS